MTSDKAALQHALGGSEPKRKKPSGDPGGWKLCTEKCLRVEAKLAVGCICQWGCWKPNQFAKSQHIRMSKSWLCQIDHSRDSV